ncbi:cubilin-like [Branchiostoma floridae]|uniref:Cubilin-like n=1 Tax=Branchiostoma floridae TaxID=7739 RepID=A0A9J7NDQ4_BRAFL|nr:cubilin-like [Branchiostoma floridae]
MMAMRDLVICVVIYFCLAEGLARCSRSRPSKACGRTMSAYRGSIRSPGFPNPYPPALRETDQECKWIINLPYGHGIKLTFSGYDLNDETNDVGSEIYDELQVFRDGSCDESQRQRSLIGMLEGELVIYIPHKTACIKFIRRTLNNKIHGGFSLTYEVVDANSKCGGNNTVMVTSQEGYIYSPGYPTASYPPYLNCTWMVEVQPDQTLDVSFLDFQLSYTYSCDFAPDFVEIGNSNRTYEYKYCDQDVPETFLSRGNRVWVHFRTGQWRNRGFWLYYKAVGEPTAADQPNPNYRQEEGRGKQYPGATNEAPQDKQDGSNSYQQFVESPGFSLSPMSPVIVLTVVMTKFCETVLYL